MHVFSDLKKSAQTRALHAISDCKAGGGDPYAWTDGDWAEMPGVGAQVTEAIKYWLREHPKHDEGSVCRRPGCGQLQVTRGLCRRCYQRAVYLVRKGKTTWDKLESGGKVAAARNRGRQGSVAAKWLLS